MRGLTDSASSGATGIPETKLLSADVEGMRRNRFEDLNSTNEWAIRYMSGASSWWRRPSGNYNEGISRVLREGQLTDPVRYSGQRRRKQSADRQLLKGACRDRSLLSLLKPFLFRFFLV